MFSHPDNFSIVTGTVIDINITGVRFLPDSPEKTSGILENIDIRDCSLQLDDKIFTFTARIFRNNKVLSLVFQNFTEEAKTYLSEFIAKAPERAVASLTK